LRKKITGWDQEQKQGDNRRKTMQNNKSLSGGASDIAPVLILLFESGAHRGRAKQKPGAEFRPGCNHYSG
jgi:hypothetical protein